MLDGVSGQIYQSAGGKPTLLDAGQPNSAVKADQGKNLTETWALSATNMAIHQGLAHKIDRLSAPAGQPAQAPTVKGYGHWLGLGSQQVNASAFSLKDFGKTVSGNLSGQGLGTANTGFSTKAFAKETLIDRNFKPVKDLVTGQSNGNRGQGLLNATGLGLVGVDVFRHSRDTYKDSRQRGESAWDTTLDTATSAGKYAVRSAVSWESAGFGFALGKALLPLSIKGVPVGGVLTGALGGMFGQKTADKVLKTGDQDPVQQRKALAAS